jgi:SAM-dependent methyltransferase
MNDGDSGLPRGLRWRLTARVTNRSRQERLARFLTLMRPGPGDTILDVGVTDTAWRASNFLESGYPWPERITAVGLSEMPTFRTLFPDVTFVVADGRRLPFEDQTFDVGFSNAVIEHVGSRDEQRKFVSEMLRTCRRVFVATPNAGFPIDPHTVLPFVHWLPIRIRYPLLRWTGNALWANEATLNPLSAQDLCSMFPASLGRGCTDSVYSD